MANESEIVKSLKKNIDGLNTLINFSRNLKTKDDLITAKEMLEYALYFIQSSNELVDLHAKELSSIIKLIKNIDRT